MRRTWRSAVLSVATLVATLGGVRTAFCTEMTNFILGDTSCPDPKAVEAEVFKLTSPEGRATHLPGAEVRIFDDGNDYRVEIDKDAETYRKSYEDPARACDQRARVVAVTIVMTLVPPDLAEEAPVATEPEDSQVTPPEGTAAPRSEARVAVASEAQREETAEAREAPVLPPPRPSSLVVQLEAGGWFHHSISSSEVPRIAAWGGELLGALGTERVVGLVAFGAGGSTEFDLGEIRASMFEVTARGGARLLLSAGSVTGAFEAAFVVARRQVVAEAPNDPEAGSAWELGASVGTNVAFDISEQVAPVAGIRLNVFPVPSELEAAPRGPIGTLPQFWLGAHAGVRFGF